MSSYINSEISDANSRRDISSLDRPTPKIHTHFSRLIVHMSFIGKVIELHLIAHR